jgi:hypothetical protein
MYRVTVIPVTSGQEGIKETLDVTNFLKLFIMGYKASKGNDGVIKIPGDLSNFIQAAFALPAAIQGFGKIPKELLDIDPQEQGELDAALTGLTEKEAARRVLRAFVEFGDAIVELVQSGTVPSSNIAYTPITIVPSSGEYGIEETNDVFNFLGLAVAGYQAAATDGIKFPDDMVHFINAAFALPKAIEGISKVPAELMDLQKDEASVIISNFSQIVTNALWQRVFAAFIEFGDALVDAIEEEK